MTKHNENNWEAQTIASQDGGPERAESITDGKRHHYVDCGLDNVWIEGGFNEVPSPYGVGIAILDLDGLHKCIGHCLVAKPAALNGAEFRFLRTELNLSQHMMGLLCGCQERTIREWETRVADVDEPANTIIRLVYEQRYKTSEATYEEFSKNLRELQAADKKRHELKLKNTGAGWEIANNCKAA